MKTKYIFKSVVIATLGMLALNILYHYGSSYAAEFGNRQRGGVGWGIEIHYFSYILAFVLFMQSYLHYTTNIKAWKVLIASIVIYTVLSFVFLGNNFSGTGWKYPYRYTYFMLCSYALLIAPLMKQLTSKSTRTK